MATPTPRASRDWLGSTRANLAAWWLPHALIIATLFAAVPLRLTVWVAALAWMGVACILNARRCGRTHCRYTGPYYLAAILPALTLGWSTMSVNLYLWLGLAALVLLGSKLIWWITERIWGKFS